MEDKKIYYSISEVCRICKIKPHNLRNWENSILFIHPKKNKFGHRIYTQGDIKKITLIKKMLYDDKITIKGINEFFLKHDASHQNENVISIQELWLAIKYDMENIKKCIDKN